MFEKDAVYDVHIEEGDYVVIAEREGEASYLGIRGEGSKDVWYLPHDGPIEKVGNTLEAAIRNRLP